MGCQIWLRCRVRDRDAMLVATLILTTEAMKSMGMGGGGGGMPGESETTALSETNSLRYGLADEDDGPRMICMYPSDHDVLRPVAHCW